MPLFSTIAHDGAAPARGFSLKGLGRHAVQKPIASLMAVGLLVLAACGTGGEVEPGPVTSFEDIAGFYLRDPVGHGPIYFQFSEDGTWHASSNRDLVEDRPQSIMETRFEGTKVFLKETKAAACGDDLEAIYEIHLLENGNLQLVAIEDKCLHRSGDFEAEWAPVP